MVTETNKNWEPIKTIEKLYTVRQLAKALQINEQTLLRFIREKRIKAIRVGREYRIKEKDYMDFIKG